MDFATGLFQASVSRPMVDFMLNELNLSKYMAQLEGRFAIDEFFLTTLHTTDALNVPGGFTHVCLDRGIETKHVSRYNIWSFEHELKNCYSGDFRHSLCIFGLEDLHRLTTLPHLFVNKMMPDYDFGAMVCWYEHMFNRTHVEPPNSKNLNPDYYLSMPHKMDRKRKKISYNEIDPETVFDFRKFRREYEERERNGHHGSHPSTSSSSSRSSDRYYNREKDKERHKKSEDRHHLIDTRVFTRPDGLRPSIQSRVSLIGSTVKRDETATYKSLPVEKAKVRRSNETFSVSYIIIQILENHIIGHVKSDMNGKVVPFLDLTDAPLFMKPDEKPQLLDEFIVSRMENVQDFHLPWNCQDMNIDDFMKNGHILPGGKALSMSLVKNDVNSKIVPAVIFLVHNEDTGKYMVRILFDSGSMMIISCPISNLNLSTSIKMSTDHFQYQICWASLRSIPRDSRVGETYVLPPGCILNSDDEPLKNRAWTISKIEPLSKGDDFSINNFLPGRYRCSQQNEQAFIEFYESFTCTELEAIIKEEEAKISETQLITTVTRLSNEIPDVPKISIMQNFDDISDDFIKFWQKGAMFQVSENPTAVSFAAGIVVKVKCHENYEGMYENYEIFAHVWPIGAGSPSRAEIFEAATTGSVECCLTLDLNLKVYQEQFEFFKKQKFSDLLLKKADCSNLKTLRLLMGLLEFEEDIQPVSNYDDSSSALSADQNLVVAKLLNSKNHVAILESTSVSEKPTLLIEYAKSVFSMYISSQMLICHSDDTIKNFTNVLNETSMLPNFSTLILTLFTNAHLPLR
uniref:Uncharacterized protein n=1 Tax=Acrobeloides nanus TaxID=290746 RepID=A0A914ENK6_9BILA